jgi:4-hydroxy-3-methylbut-2-enyl diphosphate reductase
VVGSKNSSNSTRLRELGEEQGVKSVLIDSVKSLSKDMFAGINSVGISSGASAPEHLVLEIIEWLKKNFSLDEIIEERVAEETTKFSLPSELAEQATCG